MDKAIKGTVHRITGSIPAGNYIQLPKLQSQSLGLTGKYVYILFKPIPTKYFVVHIDVATQDNLVVRISFSNLFKEFKSTSTWLQFPFMCNTPKGSVHSLAASGSKDHSGIAPLATRWTVLCMDFSHVLSLYLNRKFSYLKSVRLCANMMVKNIFTSDNLYEPGLTVDKAKKAGLLGKGLNPMPRDMSFPAQRGENWNDLYDFIRFPNDNTKKPFDSIQFSDDPEIRQGVPSDSEPKRVNPRTVNVSQCVTDRVTMINKITQPKQKMKRHKVTTELPFVGVDDVSIVKDSVGEVHVFAHPEEEVVVHQENTKSGQPRQISKLSTGSYLQPQNPEYKSLEPDPILRLKRIVGFGGCSFRDALWTSDGSTVIYPCHAVVIAMKVNNGHQRFFIGHTDKVSCIGLNGAGTLLASGQMGPLSVVRIWKFDTGECMAMTKTHAHSLHSLSFSHRGSTLCGVGKDSHGKNMVVIWNTSKVMKNREVSVMAKAHSDVDISRMKIAGFDDMRMVSCGRDNVRLWRVKEGQLRSAPVNLGEYHLMEFTDICFEAGYHADKDPADRIVYACSKTGHVFEIDLQKVSIKHVRRLLPNENKASKEKQKGTGLAINSMSVNETFCVMGSDDGYLRLWPLDFEHVYLEAEHEGPVTAVDFSADGMKILAGTSTGNLGILDISTRGYTTVMRSHTGRISGVAVDPYRKHMATVSSDFTIRVWDSDTLQQLYDFSAPNECPCAISYHPSRQIFACGFESGVVRVFNVQTTSMLAEHKQHRGKIIGLAFSPVGDYLYSACSLGSLSLYDAESDRYTLLRLLANTVVRSERLGPEAIAVSPDGRRVAFIGPSEFTVCVVDAKSLSEVLRIDISSSSSCDSKSGNLDSAERVYFAPQNVGHLLVTTANNKLLKFDAKSGRLLSEIGNIHRSGCSCVGVSESGRYLVTCGDKVIKVWDYNMKLDINFQVFIGHSENVSKVIWTPDGKNVLSVGEAIYLWDFMAFRPPSPPNEGRQVRETSFPNYPEPERIGDTIHDLSKSLADTYLEMPRRTPPRPTRPTSAGTSGCIADLQPPRSLGSSPGRVADLSSIHKVYDDTMCSSVLVDRTKERNIMTDQTSDCDSIEILPSKMVPQSLSDSYKKIRSADNSRQNTPIKFQTKKVFGKRPGTTSPTGEPVKPVCVKHFLARKKEYGLAQRRYTAPPNQAGVKLKSVIGYNGNGRGNMVWHPDTGLFIYTCGAVIIIEDLDSGKQNFLMGHTEEISTVAIQNDSQVMASASGSFGISPSQICIWDLQQQVCRKVLSHHEHNIVCLDYSRDDRFLISVGDYQDSSIVVWSTLNYEILTTSKTTTAIHDLKWDPFSVNEFVSVGQGGSVLFWLLDETRNNVCLNVHEADVPEELLQKHGSNDVIEFTSIDFSGDSTLYISTNNGKVSAWDTRHNTCFMHWEADNSEIVLVICRNGRLLTGSVGKNLRMWTLTGVSSMRSADNPSMPIGGLTMEDEMNLDGSVVAAAFDESLDMGIVGTSCGTLWYINWPERESIRLVSSHVQKINSLSCFGNEHLASCSDDGTLRLWNVGSREQALQFQVLNQKCTCLAFAPGQLPAADDSKEKIKVCLPFIVAGYSDGTVRMFDVNKEEMVLKMHPHAVSVSAISFSSDGRMIISGGSDGLIAVSSPTTGMTVRVISDHKGAPITNIDVTTKQELDSPVSAPYLWLATSADRRVSVWSSDWTKDFCELVDWLTFPAPAFMPDGSLVSNKSKKSHEKLPTTLAKFSTEEDDVLVYVGYGMQKCIQFYSLSQRKVIRTAPLTHWSSCLDVAGGTPLLAVGVNERLVKLVDYYEGSFQDFVGHCDSVSVLQFSHDSKHLYSISHSEIFIWEVTV
ncbi:WD repeat-containing protein 90-like isoform X2 [Ostrea edulis]|nr:WD repeat-containing protein 90-like isoform X2 [Ostrea edulis]